MVHRKIDNRIRTLIENAAALGHRTFVVLVGDKSRDQVLFIHHMLSKSSLKQARVLWCYKKELSLSSNKRKRIKQIRARMKAGAAEVKEDDPFETFVSLTEIRYCYYKETHKILGNTFKMCVLQDFEALTPNILCRTMETVEGGGVIVVLLQSMSSLKQLYTLSMDVHARYRTESHKHIVPRFNERFILSLPSCPSCIVMDDMLRVLPISSHVKIVERVPFELGAKHMSPQETELKELKDNLKDNPPIGLLVNLCKTLDQAKAVLQFILAITQKTLRLTISLTAARGRGKSAALGIAMAGAIAFGYSNIFVTSPSPENLGTLFEFVLKGFAAMNYEEHLHFQVLRSADPQFNKSIMRITVNKGHRQIIQYISPKDKDYLGQAELLVIDEAAAIPMPLVKELLGPYLIFLSSTVSGYEGTGRSLSLKLLDQIRQQTKESEGTTVGRVLHEVSLEESIRYKRGDPVEAWLYNLLCLEASLPALPSSVPPPEECQLFYVNRDTLFGYHSLSEKFLANVMSLLVASHYRNSPDDLQTLSDAPAHHLFVLLPSSSSQIGDKLPDVFCVIQVALEGKISKKSQMESLGHAVKAAGDLIPWTMCNLYQNDDFPQLSGARIVRIATHAELQKKGYGTRALKLLEEYYARGVGLTDVGPTDINENIIHDSEVGLLEEKLLPNAAPLPLLVDLSERPPEGLHYLGVSYGASSQLLTFWKRAGFTPVYLSQVSNPLTGEHTVIMLKVLGETKQARGSSWLAEFWFDYQRRMLNLFAFSLQSYSCKFALSILTNSIYKKEAQMPPEFELKQYIRESDLKRLEEFCNNQCELSLISDLYTPLAKLYFLRKFPNFKLKPVQAAILCGVGIQRKDHSDVASELCLEKDVVMQQNHFLVSEFSQHVAELWKNSEATRKRESSSEEVMDPQIADELKQRLAVEESNRSKVRELLDLNQYKVKSFEEELIPMDRVKKIKMPKSTEKKGHKDS